ncbi:endonuclease/exonuclease/phosphatase family protein [Brachybacterium sillae]|uniref:endonuclease/exonuclease/phosphatase family protein n=1 Tax=Brachybacterium sillae TaxID=2810536 RepID=UPI00217E06D6|nr:endonuclease/exonuclease/phosphatase family protein [Brachybacterium sillae]
MAARVVRRGMEPVAQVLSDPQAVYPRGIAAVRLSVPGGGQLMVSTIHLALQQDNRVTHAREAVERVRRAGCPVVMGGDLNETADGPARRILDEVLRDPAEPTEHTFPATRPRRRIDAVLVTPGLRVRTARALRSAPGVPAARMRTASDHLGTVVDLDI